MNHPTPYAPPQTPVQDIEESLTHNFELADRGDRFVANLIDGVIVLVPIALIFGASYVFLHWRFWESISGLSPLGSRFSMFVFVMLAYLAINGAALSKSGQSLGMRVCKIQIVKLDGSIPTLWDSLVKRKILLTLLEQIPFLGAAISGIDSLMFFRKDKRCLHDHLAGTIVVKCR